MTLPDLFDFKNTAEFFKAFIEINKKTCKAFSYEIFSRKTKWPKSLLHELASGRRNLSIARAIEFANTFHLDSTEAERLITMSLYSQSDEGIKNYFEKKLNPEWQNLLIKKDESTRKLSHNLNAIAINTLIRSRPGKWTPREIADSFLTMPLLDEKAAKETVDLLIKNGIIIKDKKGVLKSTGKNIFHDDLNEEVTSSANQVHQEFADSFINYCKSPIKGPASYYSLFLNLKKKDFERLRKKMIALVQDLDKMDSNSKIDTTEEYQFFQFDINAVPVAPSYMLSKTSSKET